MAPNSAYDLVDIVVGTDYTPAATTRPFEGNPSITVAGPMSAPVYALFCTTTNSGTTTIKTLAGNSIVFPIGSFKQGVVYYIYLGTLVADGGATFVGLKYNGLPMTL